MAKKDQAQAAPLEETGAGAGAEFEQGGEGVGMIDFSGVDENAGGFEVLPRGIYDVIVDNVEYGISQRSGNPMWTWTFELDGGDFAGRKLFFHTVLTPEQLGRTKKVLSRVAPEMLTVPIDPQVVADEGLLLGKRARCRVDIRKYEGEDRNNVRDVLPPNAEAGGDFL